MRTFVPVVAILVMVAVATPRLDAQTPHAASQAAIDRALQQHVTGETMDREVILRVLDHPEVRAVAGRAGLDLRRATSAVATMDAAELAQTAARAQQVETALAGGQSRVILWSTIAVTVLVVLILIVVAVD